MHGFVRATQLTNVALALLTATAVSCNPANATDAKPRPARAANAATVAGGAVPTDVRPTRNEVPASCPVTIPPTTSHRNDYLEVILHPQGRIAFRRGGPGYFFPDGSLGMKFGWERYVRGKLVISGRRLDAEGPPVRADIPDGYGSIGFQPAIIIFPSPGCWEVTGSVGAGKLTFVVEIARLD